MFDPQTRELIGASPHLRNLDLTRLPEFLTESYAAIVAARMLHLQGAGAGLGQETATLRRLANAYQAYVVVHDLDATSRSAAFVAATAHQLLHDAGRPDGGPNTLVRAEWVSHGVASMLLFLIAEQYADAHAVARRLSVGDGAGARSEVARGVIALGSGNLAGLSRIGISGVDSEAEGSWSWRAEQALWNRLIKGLRGLGVALLGEGSPDECRRLLAGVERDAVGATGLQRGKTEDTSPRAYFGFPGIHHLAALLGKAAEGLPAAAMGRLPPPSGCDPEGWRKWTATAAGRRPFLWANHRNAIKNQFLEPGVSSVLAFPTGAGKSTLSELKIAASLLMGKHAVVLAPTHALVGQLLRDLGAAFPLVQVKDSLVEGGEYSETDAGANKPVAPTVAVMTPERCLTFATLSPRAFRDCGVVVFDECHLLHPVQPHNARRSLDATLCLLALLGCAPGADVILISAMMSNAEELARWLTKQLGRPAVAENVTWKPTRQARGCVVYSSSEVELLEQKVAAARPADQEERPGAAIRRQMTATPQALVCLQQTWVSQHARDYKLLSISDAPTALGLNDWWQLTSNRNEVATVLAARLANAGVKTIIFVQNVQTAASVAGRVAKLLMGAGAEYAVEDGRILDAVGAELGDLKHAYLPVVGKAGCHHSLMLPEERALAEQVFRRDPRMRVLVATPTLAQGMNLPAEAVVLAGDDRFDGDDGMEMLAAHELLNAAGRAGRAGHMPHGVVLVVPGRVVPVDWGQLTVGNRWHELRREVLSQGDQCLAIGDAISIMLDAIQSEDSVDPADLRYFLTRLPRADEEAASALFRRSLSAFRAAESGQADAFNQKVAKAIAYRDQVYSAQSPHEEWMEVVGSKCGVEPDAIKSIYECLASIGDVETKSVSAWADVVGGWLEARPLTIQQLFRNKTIVDVFSSALGVNKKDLKVDGEIAKRVAPLLRQTIAQWMSGAPLRAIEASLGAKLKPHLERARCVALRLAPEMAYVVGLFALVMRHEREAKGQGDQMPLALAVAASCVREGVDDVGKLAYRLLNKESLSRVQVHADWGEAPVDGPWAPWNGLFEDVLRSVAARRDVD